MSYTQQDLVDFLKVLYKAEGEKTDVGNIKYIIYARKSTESEERQVRSLGDQVAECRKVAQDKDIPLFDDPTNPITESESAKEPDIRPRFRQMIDNIKSGKYGGILAWHPDRLARNMKEGGEIIDMIDDDLIKDMRFVTHHFSKDANGKMLLGMAFVLSKQYSDNLSQNVTRGVRRSFEEGRSPIPKHGYIKDDDGFYRPDGENFKLVVKAWQMRKEGISLEAIASYLNANNYGRKTKTGKVIKMTKQILTDLFKDPFYYGILLQANKEVDLRTIYNFQPATTEENYIEVQRISGSRVIPYKKKKVTTYYPLKMMIICAFCNNHMYVGASQGSSGKENRYLFYRCDTKYCIRNSKENKKKKRKDPSKIKASIRGRTIFDFIYKFLEKGLNFTEKEYNEYLSSMSSLTSEKREKLRMEIHSLQGRQKAATREKEDLAYKIIKFVDKESPISIINEKKVIELQDEEESLKAKIEELKSKLGDPKQEILSIEEFLNLSKQAAIKIKSADPVIKDYICRKVFLNLTVDNEKVLSYQAKEPFATLLKQRHKSSSRGERT